MSRNVRKRSYPASRKAAKRRDSITSSSTFDLSDEDGYSAVEDISDSSDDDEEDVVAAEENHILHEALPSSISGSPRPPIAHEDEDDDEDQEEEEEEDVAADVENGASWDGMMSDVDESATSDNQHRHHELEPMERRVRFDVPSSDSDSTDTEDDHADFFPDIFVDQSSLDPAFRREIENDDENDESENSNSYWDYHGDYHGAHEYAPDADSDIEDVIRNIGDETPTAYPLTTGKLSELPTPVAAFEESQELDGYETDGDTTEEDEPEPVVRRKMKRPEQVGDRLDDSDTDHPVKGERGQPRVGRFNLDNSERKPIAVLNPITRKMMIFTPHRRCHLDLSPEQFDLSCLASIDESQNSPMLSNSAQIMMSAMFSSNTFGDYLNTQAMGPSEAFFPFQSEPNTADENSSVEVDEDGEDEYEKSLDINDFIEFDETQSLEGEEKNQWDGELQNSTQARHRSSSDLDIHSHLNANNVGAFRRDQINQRLILSDKATQDSLALSSPYNYTALRGIKSDRFETAAAPLTPMRRSKKQIHDLARSPLESVSQKRKASSEIPVGHKRQRSISDVNLLRI